jgi:hypothetical protein
MKARWPLISAVLLLLSGCNVAPSELDGLSRANAEAYVVLRDQLGQMPDRLGPSSESVTFCVIVHSPEDPQGLHVDPTLIARLQGHVPANLNAVVASGTKCHETEGALGLYALFGMGEPDEWGAGYDCGGLCGEGNVYRIYHVFGYPVAIRTSSFMS